MLSKPINQNQLTIELATISCSKGVLKFKSLSDFENVVKDLNGKSMDFIIDWNKRLGIKSQESIFQEINVAENECRDKQAAQLDPNITFEQFKEAGLTWDHSSLYNEYLQKGLIIEMTDPDGCKWYKHNTLNPTLMPVLNEQGFVMINDTLFQFTSNKVKFSPQGSLSRMTQMSNTIETNSEQNIFVVNYKSRKKSGGNWSNSTGWIYDGSKKRVTVDVVSQCPDWSGLATFVWVTYYLEVTSHKKVLFWWNIRNNYMPIDVTQGSWYWVEYYTDETACHSGTHYYTNFPWSGKTNYCKFYLNPNGWVGKVDPLLYDFRFNDYTFSVSADGYQTSALTVDIP